MLLSANSRDGHESLAALFSSSKGGNGVLSFYNKPPPSAVFSTIIQIRVFPINRATCSKILALYVWNISIMQRAHVILLHHQLDCAPLRMMRPEESGIPPAGIQRNFPLNNGCQVGWPLPKVFARWDILPFHSSCSKFFIPLLFISGEYISKSIWGFLMILVLGIQSILIIFWLFIEYHDTWRNLLILSLSRLGLQRFGFCLATWQPPCPRWLSFLLLWCDLVNVDILLSFCIERVINSPQRSLKWEGSVWGRKNLRKLMHGWGFCLQVT